MATSTQQKQELFKSIWAIANELRGSVDGWDFKQYVLGMLFYRYISENITNYINALQRKAGYPDFDYAAFDDAQAESARESIVTEKGFFILPSQLFCNVRKRAAKDENLNMTLAAAFKSIEASAIGTDSEDDMEYRAEMEDNLQGTEDDGIYPVADLIRDGEPDNDKASDIANSWIFLD